MKTDTPKVLLEGLVFPEGPRWHAGKLYLSDIWARRVVAIAPDGRAETVVEVPHRPSGLGFDRAGRLLVVSMEDRKLLRLDDGTLTTVADLSTLATADLNDMVVGPDGRAFIGHFGFDLFAGATPAPASLLRVDPDGTASVAADALMFPNGCVITPDQKTLIVAETFDGLLTAFNLKPDGSLSGRRFFAHLGDRQPDGICLDAEGAVWAACFGQDEFLRVWEGGEVAERIPVVGRRAVACALGGEDRRTLFLLTAETTIEDLARGHSRGRVEQVRVEVPGAGWP